MYDKRFESVTCPKIYFINQNGPKVGRHENEYKGNRYIRKGRRRNGIICLVSFLTFVVLKLPKKVYFLHFSINVSKKAKFVKAIYVYASESSHYTVAENDFVYMSLSNHSSDVNG